VLCQLAHGLSLLCGFCPPDEVRGRLHSHVCAPASFRPLLAETPLPSARTFVSIHYYEHLKVLVQGTSCLCIVHADRSPHKITPMPGLHKQIEQMPFGHSSSAAFSWLLTVAAELYIRPDRPSVSRLALEEGIRITLNLYLQ
jgi:hypothetical protein